MHVDLRRRFVPVPSLPAALQVRRPIFDYDAKNRRVVVLQPPTEKTPLEVWTWDPATDEWNFVPQVGPYPSSKRSMGMRVFAYLPDHNVFVCLERRSLYCPTTGPTVACGGKTTTWLYRLQA